MAVNIVMPKFGFSMEEGIIGQWYVKEGDSVKKGAPLAAVESEKLTNDAVADSDGIVAKIVLQEGESAPCGDTICILALPGEEISLVENKKADAPAAEEKNMTPVVEKELPKISPRAKKLAEDKGVDYSGIKGSGRLGMIELQDIKNLLSTAPKAGNDTPAISPRAQKYAQDNGLTWTHIKGTGRLGMISIEDVKAFGTPVAALMPDATASAPIPSPACVKADDEELIKMSSMRQTIASAMQASLQNTAQLTNFSCANMTELRSQYRTRKGIYQEAGIRLTYTALVIKAVAMALEAHSEMRLQVVDETHMRRINSVDIGVAVDIPKGLIVPVIRQANLKDLRSICMELADLSSRAAVGALTGEDLGGACMTVSNLGGTGVTYFTPVLNAPESLILGVGEMVEQPVARNGGIFVEPVMGLSLTYDHRVIDGAPAGRFAQTIVKNLEEFRWL